MKRIRKAIYQKPEEIDARIAELSADAAAMSGGPDREGLLREIAQLRMYADAKRWIDSPGLKRGA